MSNLFEEQEMDQQINLKKKKFYKGQKGHFTSSTQAEIYKAKQETRKQRGIAKFWEDKCHRLESRLRTSERNSDLIVRRI